MKGYKTWVSFLVTVLVFVGGVFRISEAYGDVYSQALNESLQITLALRYVELIGDDGSDVLYRAGVKQIVQDINSIYSKCAIHFKLEDYITARPDSLGLPGLPESAKEMWTFRKPFDDNRYLVVIKTGKWDHQKTGTPNAWTAMPGETPLGVVIEAPVASFAGILAHELGHYLNLHHVEDPHNLMNPMIYQSSNEISSHQCYKMRTTALSVHSAALRTKNI